MSLKIPCRPHFHPVLGMLLNKLCNKLVPKIHCYSILLLTSYHLSLMHGYETAHQRPSQKTGRLGKCRRHSNWATKQNTIKVWVHIVHCLQEAEAKQIYHQTSWNAYLAPHCMKIWSTSSVNPQSQQVLSHFNVIITWMQLTVHLKWTVYSLQE